MSQEQAVRNQPVSLQRNRPTQQSLAVLAFLGNRPCTPPESSPSNGDRRQNSCSSEASSKDEWVRSFIDTTVPPSTKAKVIPDRVKNMIVSTKMGPPKSQAAPATVPSKKTSVAAPFISITEATVKPTTATIATKRATSVKPSASHHNDPIALRSSSSRALLGGPRDSSLPNSISYLSVLSFQDGGKPVLPLSQPTPPPPPPPPAAQSPARRVGSASNAQPPRLPMFDSFVCPITECIMKDPVITPMGRSYEREAIMTWLEKSRTDPLGGGRLCKEQLIPNLDLKSAIEEFHRFCKAYGVKCN